MSGRFIVLEGPDGSGTTRHTEFLAENLRSAGLPVLVTKEPTDGQLGQTIRSLLQKEGSMAPETLQLLFCADRAEHVANVILPALEQGTTVISDRYTLSTLVYGAAMGVDDKWLEQVNNHFPKPDVTLVTLPPFEVCKERLGSRSYKDAFETELLQKRIYEGYRSREDTNTVFIDTSANKELVAQHVFDVVKERLSLPVLHEHHS